MRRIFLLLPCLLLLFSTSKAQTLHGYIVEKSDEALPIEGVIVRLYDEDDNNLSVVSTNSKGYFRLSVDMAEEGKPYILDASMLGYEPLMITIVFSDEEDMDLGVLHLKVNETLLDEVTIMGRGKTLADGHTIFPSSRIKDQAQTGYELIQKLMLPNIKVNPAERQLTTLTGESTLVLINDKKASVTELLTLRTTLVDRVEYIDAPGAEFGEDLYGAVIKIYVKQPESGISGGINLINAVTTISGQNFAYFRYNNKQSELGLTYENDIMKVRRRSISQVDHYHMPDNSTYTVEREGIDTPLSYYTHKGTMYYNHTKPDHHVLNVTLIGTWYDSRDRGHDQRVTEQGLPSYLSSSRPTERYFSPEVDLFYLQHFSNKSKIRYNLHGTIISTDYGFKYNEVHPLFGDRSYGYNTNGLKRSIINELLYDQKIKDYILYFGARHLFSETINTYTGSEDAKTSLKNHDVYIYTQLFGSIQKLQYMVGVGVNYLNANQGKHRSESWLWRPRLALTLPVDTWTFQYYFQMTPMAPTLAALSDVSQQSNAWEITSGNPLLRPYNYIFNRLSIQKILDPSLTITSQIGVSNRINPITPTIDRITRGDQSLFVHSYTNAGRNDMMWATLSLRWNAIPEKLVVNGTIMHRYYDMKGLDYHHTLHNTLVNIDTDLTLGKWNLMTGFSSGNRSLSNETLNISIPNFYLLLRYQLGDWTIGLNATHLFKPYGLRMQEEQLNRLHSYYQDLRVPSMKNKIALSLSWNFSRGRQYSGEKSTLQNSDSDAGILKF